MKRVLFRSRKTLQENNGAESIEWIAIIAILMVLLFALSSIIGQRSPDYAEGISETITYYTGLWGGEDVRNTGASAGGPPSSGQESSAGGRGFWDHVKGAAYGFFVDGAYETGKGLLVLGKDLVVMAPITGDLIDLVVPGIQGETRDKYAQLIEAIADNPSAAAQAMVQPMIDAWNDEDYGRLVGMGIFEAAALFIPGDEAGKIGWVTRIDRVLPDEVLASISRIEKMTPDELADAARRGEALAPEEMSAIRRRLDEMTPEQRAQYDELVRGWPCLIAHAPTKRPPGLASMVPMPSSAPCVRIDAHHIFRGENAGGKAKGFHHRGSIGHGGHARVVSGSETAKRSDGVYQATVEIKNTVSGQWKSKRSTFFPDDWNRQKVLDEVRGAYQNRVVDPNNSKRWTGTSPSGVPIEGFLDDAGNIRTAYPVWP